MILWWFVWKALQAQYSDIWFPVDVQFREDYVVWSWQRSLDTGDWLWEFRKLCKVQCISGWNLCIYVSSQTLLQSNTVDKSHSYQHRFTCVHKRKFVCVSRLEELLSMKCPYYPRLHGHTMSYLSKSIYY